MVLRDASASKKAKEEKEEKFLRAGTRTGGPIKGSTRGPRGPKNTLYVFKQVYYVHLRWSSFIGFQNQTACSVTARKSLIVNQYTNSVTEMKLIPRQSPQIPPRFEMKSSQVIFCDLSNSEEVQIWRNWTKYIIFQTKDGWASKEYVHHSNVLVICIVVVVFLWLLIKEI